MKANGVRENVGISLVYDLTIRRYDTRGREVDLSYAITNLEIIRHKMIRVKTMQTNRESKSEQLFLLIFKIKLLSLHYLINR